MAGEPVGQTLVSCRWRMVELPLSPVSKCHCIYELADSEFVYCRAPRRLRVVKRMSIKLIVTVRSQDASAANRKAAESSE